MTDRVPVLVNRDGGTAAAMGGGLCDAIESAFVAAGMAIDVHLLDGRDVAAAVRNHSAAPLIVIGGGDGTIGTAAGASTVGVTLGILPLGTRNHFARDLGLPLDLNNAARTIATGRNRTIDVARVNGRLFLNNASIGLYPDLVRRRDAEQDRHHLPKWLAAFPAGWGALKRLRHHRLHLRSATGERDIVTPLLFVGNNRYDIAAGQIGRRNALDDGTFSVIAVAARRRRALIGIALRTLVGRVDSQQDFAAIGDATALTVTGRSRDIDIALDGEPVELSMPLEFTMHPKGLVVIAPR